MADRSCFDIAGDIDQAHSRLKVILELMDNDLNTPSKDSMTKFVLVECAQMYEGQVAALIQELCDAAQTTIMVAAPSSKKVRL